MATVPIELAATQLPELFARVEAGEEVVIANGESSGMRLVSVAPPADAPYPRRHTFGMLKGKLSTPASFWEPLPPGHDGWPDDGPQ